MPWRGPCQTMARPLPQAAAALPQVRFAKVNTPDQTTPGQRFNIRSIPTLVLFVKRQEVQRQAGAMDAASIQRWLAAGLRQAAIVQSQDATALPRWPPLGQSAR